MGKDVLQDKRGFTLIEALVSIVILSLILIGLLSSMLVAYRISLRNQIRNEAVHIANEKLNFFRENLDTGMFKHENCTEANDNDAVIRRIRNIDYKYYVVGKIQEKGYVYEVNIKVCDKDKKELYRAKTLVSK